MEVRITLDRDREVPVVSWDDDFRRKFESYLEANPGAGLIKDPTSLYRRLWAAQHDLIECVAEILEDDGRGPFTLTLDVRGSEDPPKNGPQLY